MKNAAAYILENSCRFLTNRAVFSYKSGQSCRFSPQTPRFAAVFLQIRPKLPFLLEPHQSCRFSSNPAKAAVFAAVYLETTFWVPQTPRPVRGVYLGTTILTMEYSETIPSHLLGFQ